MPLHECNLHPPKQDCDGAVEAAARFLSTHALLTPPLY